MRYVALAMLFATGCANWGASSVTVDRKADGETSVTAPTLDTGTTIAISKDGDVAITRASVSQTTGRLDGLLGGILKTLLGAGVVP